MLPLLAGAVRLGDGLRDVLPRRRAEHPEPRPDVTAEKVLSRDAYEREVRKLVKNEKRFDSVLKKVSKSYEQAREIPEILDGLYCYCECSSYGHRSLLTCFEVVQAVGCGACKEEANLAYDLHRQGKTLAEIRAAVDKEYD